MPIKLYLRPNGVYHLRGTVQGQRVDQSARTRSRGEAEAIRAEVEAKLFRRAVYGERAVATFDDAAVIYIETGGSPDHLDPILTLIAHRRLAEINQQMVDRLARDLKPQASAATRLRQVYTPVLAVMNAAAQAGLCEPIRLKKPKVAGGRTAYLTPQEAEDWLCALSPAMRQIVTFYLGSGCRATEALSLVWRDITLGERRAVFWETKGGYARGVDLQRRVRDQLPGRSTDPGELVFRNTRGEPWHAYDAINLRLGQVREQRAAAIAAGSDLPPLAHAHCHLFRHTWATWAYACTRDLTYLMSQGGWRSVSMVMRYTHVASDDLAGAVLDAGWEFFGREIPRPRKSKARSTASRA